MSLQESALINQYRSTSSGLIHGW